MPAPTSFQNYCSYAMKWNAGKYSGRHKKKGKGARSTASAYSTMASIWPAAAVVGEYTPKNQIILKQTTGFPSSKYVV